MPPRNSSPWPEDARRRLSGRAQLAELRSASRPRQLGDRASSLPNLALAGKVRRGFRACPVFPLTAPRCDGREGLRRPIPWGCVAPWRARCVAEDVQDRRCLPDVEPGRSSGRRSGHPRCGTLCPCQWLAEGLAAVRTVEACDRDLPRISDAELVTLAVMQALLGFVSEAHWLRYAGKHLRGPISISAGPARAQQAAARAPPR